PMHDTACFRGSQRTRGLLNYFQRKSRRHWSITANAGFQRFALNQFHGIETLAVLLSVISHPSDVGMMNVCSRARFAQKTRTRPGILRHPAVDDLESNLRVQHCIASAVSYGHRSRAELDRETIRTYLHFEVGVSQLSRRQSTARRWSFSLFAVRQKAKANEATQAPPIRTALSQRAPTCSARPRGLRLRCSETDAFVVHALSQLTPSIFDRDGVAPDRHLPNQRRYWPLPFSMIRGNAGGDAKATCAESQLALRVEPQLPPDSAASRFRPRRTVLVLRATQL